MSLASRIALMVVEAFVALTAIAGGIALITGIEDRRFSPALLAGTPFQSYLFPGLILAVVVGGSAAIAFGLMLFKPRIGAFASIGAGLILVGWILGEVVILSKPEARSATELVYLLLGVATTALGFFTRSERAPLDSGKRSRPSMTVKEM